MALSINFTQCAPETTTFGKITQNKGHYAVQRSFKVTNFGTNRKLIYDFLSVISTNVPPILHRLRGIAFGMLKNDLATPLSFTPPDGGIPLGRSP